MWSFMVPWKLAVAGCVAIASGVALLRVDWSVEQLAVFVAFTFVARGALHLVTLTFEGVDGALAALRAGSELAVGVVLLAWPSPSIEVVAVVVGVIVLVYAVTTGTIAVATRADERGWKLELASTLAEAALGVVLLVNSRASVHTIVVTLAVLALVTGGTEVVAAVFRRRAQETARRALSAA